MGVASIEELLWDDQNIARLAHHRVTPLDVEGVVFQSEPLFFDAGQAGSPGHLVVLGVTHARRYVAIYLDPPAGGRAYAVTARSMSAKERKVYRASREEG